MFDGDEAGLYHLSEPRPESLETVGRKISLPLAIKVLRLFGGKENTGRVIIP